VLAFQGESPAGIDSSLGQSFAEDLIAGLSRDVRTPVVSGRSSFQLDLKKLSIQDVARQLRVRYLVDGRVRRDGEQGIIRTQLVEGGDGRVRWLHDDRAGVSDLAAMRTVLADKLASSVNASVWRVEKQRVLARPPASLDAYTLATRAYAGKHLFAPAPYRA